MNQGLISVIIPVYNHARGFKKCLDSLAAQTYQNIEVIIVNDGSTDNFRELFEKIRTFPEYSRLKMQIVNQDNRGASAARNRGFAMAKGGYLIFWDADTIAKPEMLETMKKTLDQNPAAAYAYSQFRYGWKKFRSGEFNTEELKKFNYIDTTSLIRSDSAEKFDENLRRFQDWDLWLSMSEKNKKGIFIPEVLYKKKVLGRAGISRWLPRFVYRLPFKIKPVRQYEEATGRIREKHFPRQ